MRSDRGATAMKRRIGGMVRPRIAENYVAVRVGRLIVFDIPLKFG